MTKTIETPISFLKPDYLLRAEEDYQSEKITRQEMIEAQDKAIAELVAKQLQAGLTIITDGAYRRINGLRDFWMSLTGVEPTVVVSGHVFQDQNAGEVIPRVVDKIAFNPEHDILYAYSFLRKEAGDGPIARVDIPAPSLFYLDLIRNEWYDRNAYPDTAELASDIAKAYRETLCALYDQGCRRVLLVDRSWERLCDRIGAKRLVQGGIDLVNLPRTLLEINEEAIKDLPADMHVILYTPFETPLKQECEEIVKYVCSHQRVDAFMTDLPDSADSLYEFMHLLPQGKEVIIGVEDAAQPQILPHEQIQAIMANVAGAVPASKITLTTKGGFANNTDSINFSAFDEPDQWHKIDNLLTAIN